MSWRAQEREVGFTYHRILIPERLEEGIVKKEKKERPFLPVSVSVPKFYFFAEKGLFFSFWIGGEGCGGGGGGEEERERKKKRV